MKMSNAYELRGIIDSLLESQSRANEAKVIRYWYPLSLASFGTDEILEALDSMCSFRTSMAEKTLAFERHFAKWQGSADAVMVNSGSSADLLLCLLLTNPYRPLVKSGAEILIPVVTWPTQIWAAMMAGLKVKLVDVDPRTLNMDLDDMERSIGPETQAVSLVHLMGNPCNMDRIMDVATRHGLQILEDCCEAMGATWNGQKVGSFGVGAAYSFFFSHHITTMEGGMIAVSDLANAEQLRLLRAHGWVRNVDPSAYELGNYPEIDPRYAFVNWGLNVRPTEIQAGFGIRQLEKAGAFATRRAEIAAKFNAFIRTIPWLSTPVVEPQANPSWLALPVMISEDAPFSRAAITTHLEGCGVETRPVVTGNVAKHPVARLFPEFRARTYPGADAVHARGFYIGLSPLQTDANVDRMIETFSHFLARY